jgi:hypothetical protein
VFQDQTSGSSETVSDTLEGKENIFEVCYLFSSCSAARVICCVSGMPLAHNDLPFSCQQDVCVLQVRYLILCLGDNACAFTSYPAPVPFHLAQELDAAFSTLGLPTGQNQPS